MEAVLSRMDDVNATVSIMAAEGCEEMSGNGELEESSGSFIYVNEFIIRSFAFAQISLNFSFICREFE